jgi:hypothetical protein
MEKISIAASQNDNGLFNLVINKATTLEDGQVQNESLIKADITLDELKSYINEL